MPLLVYYTVVVTTSHQPVACLLPTIWERRRARLSHPVVYRAKTDRKLRSPVTITVYDRYSFKQQRELKRRILNEGSTRYHRILTGNSPLELRRFNHYTIGLRV